jgi:hypothetical protein
VPIDVSEYIDARAKAREMQYALRPGITLLPVNFDTATNRGELLNSAETATVRVLLRQAGLGESRLDSVEEPLPLQAKKFFEWLGPVIFVAAPLLTGNPEAVSLARSVMANFLTDFFKGIPRPHIVKFDVVAEETEDSKSSYRRYHYEGSEEGIRELQNFIRKVKP